MTNAIEGFAGLDALIHGESLVFQNRSAVPPANTATPLANAGQSAATDPLLPNMIGLADLVYGSGDDGTSTHSAPLPAIGAFVKVNDYRGQVHFIPCESNPDFGGITGRPSLQKPT